MGVYIQTTALCIRSWRVNMAGIIFFFFFFVFLVFCIRWKQWRRYCKALAPLGAAILFDEELLAPLDAAALPLSWKVLASRGTATFDGIVSNDVVLLSEGIEPLPAWLAPARMQWEYYPHHQLRSHFIISIRIRIWVSEHGEIGGTELHPKNLGSKEGLLYSMKTMKTLLQGASTTGCGNPFWWRGAAGATGCDSLATFVKGASIQGNGNFWWNCI